MIGCLIGFARMLVWWRRLKSLWWARRVAFAGVRTYEALSVVDKQGLKIGDGTLVLPQTERAAVFLGCHDELRCLSEAGGRYVVGHPWDEVVVEDVHLQLFNTQALRLAAEVFVNQVYAVAVHHPVVILDVGMNIGTAALYFARRYNAHVIGFEPFRRTYDHALSNFKANLALSDHIQPSNTAWGASAGLRTAQYCAESPGDCGFYEIPEASRGQHQIVAEEIRVQSAVECVAHARKRYPDREIVLKLDCEGAEYEILCSLREADVLRQIGIIMLEWHRRAGENMPQRIHDLLTAAGYVVFGDAIAGMECGMMRAVRV